MSLYLYSKVNKCPAVMSLEFIIFLHYLQLIT